ncbi:MAG: hypothetical protein WC906_00925 [Parcubacteria group bacterium]|jgi:hypothetical protein
MLEKKILLGLTTTPGSDWRNKIEEIKKFNIREVALFLGPLKKDKRKTIYRELEKIQISIPHVHARTDMDTEEFDYLAEKYGTKVFNIHSLKEFPLIENIDFSKYYKKIYIENVHFIPDEKEIEMFGGLCIDFSHWENGKLTNWDGYENFEELAKKYPIGCCHISAITDSLVKWPEWSTYDSHNFKKIKEFDYIKKYLKYLPDIISIELENSFEEQLKVKEYLEKIINS